MHAPEVHAHEMHAVRYTPMRYMPMRHTPMRCTPVRYTPMRHTPTPLRCPCSILDVDIVAINLIDLLGCLLPLYLPPRLPLSPRHHIRDCTLVAMPSGCLRSCCSPYVCRRRRRVADFVRRNKELVFSGCKRLCFREKSIIWAG